MELSVPRGEDVLVVDQEDADDAASDRQDHQTPVGPQHHRRVAAHDHEAVVVAGAVPDGGALVRGRARRRHVDEQLHAEVQLGGAVQRRGDVTLLAVRHDVPVGARVAGLAREEAALRVREAAARAGELVARGLPHGADAAAVAVRAPEAVRAAVAVLAGPVPLEVVLTLACALWTALRLAQRPGELAVGDGAEAGAVGPVPVRAASARPGARVAPVALAVGAAHGPLATERRAQPSATKAVEPEAAVAQLAHHDTVGADLRAVGPVERRLAVATLHPGPVPGRQRGVAVARDLPGHHTTDPVPQTRRRRSTGARLLAREPRPSEVARAAAGVRAPSARQTGPVAGAGAVPAPVAFDSAGRPGPAGVARAALERSAKPAAVAGFAETPGADAVAGGPGVAPVAAARAVAVAAVGALAVDRADVVVTAVSCRHGPRAHLRTVGAPLPWKRAQRQGTEDALVLAELPAPVLPALRDRGAARAQPLLALPVPTADHPRVRGVHGARGRAEAQAAGAGLRGRVQRVARRAVLLPPQEAPGAAPDAGMDVALGVRSVALALAAEDVACAVAAADVVRAAGALQCA